MADFMKRVIVFSFVFVLVFVLIEAGAWVKSMMYVMTPLYWTAVHVFAVVGAVVCGLIFAATYDT